MRVLIVEDEPKIAELLAKGFTEAGFFARVTPDGDEGLKLALADQFDLLLLDVMLPKKDGFTLIEELRAAGRDIPVIFLSAKRSTEDRIEGLRLGGDDYIVKPFSFSEVLVRAQGILRRTSKQVETQTIKYGDLELDLIRRTVKRGDTEIDLHPKEFALLKFLLVNRERVLSKTQILEKVWQYDFDPQTNVVDVLVCRLRNKIDRDFTKKLIKTYRGVGYAVRSE